jgi:hypothetical protein
LNSFQEKDVDSNKEEFTDSGKKTLVLESKNGKREYLV